MRTEREVLQRGDVTVERGDEVIVYPAHTEACLKTHGCSDRTFVHTDHPSWQELTSILPFWLRIGPITWRFVNEYGDFHVF